MTAILFRALLASTLVLLCSCSQGFGSADRRAAAPARETAAAPPPPPPQAPAADPQPIIPVSQRSESAAAGPPMSGQGELTTEIFPGTGTVVGSAAARKSAPVSTSDAGDITINFVNADVRDVAKAVLGDFLKLNYAVGANVQGTVTLQTSQPLPREMVLPIFEQTLRLNGLALVKTDGIYKIVALADAPRESRMTMAQPRNGGALEPGYGITIVPLKYIGATEMQRLLEPLAPAQGAVHADPVRNILIIQGTEPERAALLDNIALFDVNWLAGMSFALFTPKYTDAQDLAKELDQIVGGRTGPLAGVVRFVPIQRLNAVLAISPQAKYLEQLRGWVDRLDRPGQGTDRRLFVYHVQNGRASDLAAVLLKVLFGQSVERQTSKRAPMGDVFGTAGQTPGGTAGAAPPNPAGSPQSGVPPQEFYESYGSGVAVKEMADVNITADETNNALVIMATAQQYGVIDAALRQLDIVPLQVLLEAAIAEVTLTNDLKYGVQYFYQPNSKHQFVLSDSKTANISAVYPAFSYIFSEGTNIKVILNALSSVTHVEVVSAPQLLVLNNQTATLQVGDQVPILTAQQQSTLTSGAPIVNMVEYHDTGVILKVTPRVNQGGMVMMDISQEVSDVSATTTSTLDSPTIQLRKINSTVAVRDQETIALGGLIRDNRQKSREGIPFLQDIPLLGNLFRTTTRDDTRTELMVLITPHVVENTQKARAVTQELRDKLSAVQPIFERSR